MDITTGTPATITLYTDTTAAVISRVKGKSIWVRPVELDESTREANFPIVKVMGDVTRPKGEEERYTLRKSGRYVKVGEPDERFSVYVVLGRSVHRVNYEH